MNNLFKKKLYYGIVLLGNIFVNKIPSRSLRTLFYKIMGASIGKDSIIFRRVEVLYPKGLDIKQNSSVGWFAHLDARGGINIGSNSSIASYCKIITGSHDVDDPQFKAVFKPITIGDYCWVGTGATILQGVSLGHGVVVAAGAVVTKNVPPFTVVAGVPAKEIRRRNENLNYEVTKPPFLH